MLFAIFTISGFSGLIYESIWSHYLKLFLGHAAYAQTLVLAIFMGGMALGAWLVARSTGRIRNLLVAYAVVELLTGILALVFHKVYVGTVAFTFDSAIPALNGATSIAAFKWGLAALLILPQSILLGTTFPLISSGVIRRFPENPGETLAMLYFTNSLGAALGVLASGFWLIGAVGLPGTVMTAGMLNVLLALVVWVMARDDKSSAPSTPAVTKTTLATARWMFGAAFLAGLAAFIYEIAWIRMLSLVLGSSTHAFELMLSAFILGLALGGFWIRRRIGKFADASRALVLMFAVMAALGVLTLPAYGFSFDVMAATMRTFAPIDTGYAAFNLLSHIIAAVMMIPTTIVAGMTLPLMTHVLLKDGSGEQAIGKVYAANTVGAIAGVLLAIHFLLPVVGTKGAIVTAALLQAAIAFQFLARGQRTLLSLGTLAASLLVIVTIAAGVRLDPMRMASGVYRNGQATLPENSTVIFLRDGKTATISLARTGTTVSIATNGKTDAAINMGAGAADPDEITMTFAGALPLAVHPNPRRVANIGIGSGLTSHVILTSPVVETLDSIEIEPAIADAARLGFEPRVFNLFRDPRSHIHFEDAKTFFATARQPYDLIVSEPSNPWVSGVASLFSEEFYAHIRRYLAKGGLLVQWVQIYETDITIVASIVKALDTQFVDYVIYNTDDSNILILASIDGPIPRIRAEVLQGALGDELRKVGVSTLADIEIRRIGDKQSLQPLFESYPVPRNSDFFPFVDLTAPKMRFFRRDAVALSQLKSYPVPVLELIGEPGLLTTPVRSSSANYLFRQGRAQHALDLRGAIVSGMAGELPMDDAGKVLILRSPESACSTEGVADHWFESARSISAQTTPYLPREELQSIWSVIQVSPCVGHLTGVRRRELELLHAIAMRDRSAIIDHGEGLLRQPTALPTEQRAELLTSLTASLVGMNDDQAIARLLHDEWAFFVEHGTDILPLRLVQAVGFQRIADQQPGPTPGMRR
jgi:predicted membrane-bound spermidine synthase